MAWKLNPFTGELDYYEASTPGGSDTHVQYNDGGAFGGDSGAVWDKTNKRFAITKDSIGSTQSDSYGFLLQNTTAAASGAPQYSPPIVLAGYQYKSNAPAASQKAEYRMYVETMSASTAANALSANLVFQSSIADATYKDAMLLRTAPNGMDVIGGSGRVAKGTYVFSIQNNTATIDFQILNQNFDVEGTGFFSGNGTAFEIYATEGGGIYMIPDTSESLVAFGMDATGKTTLSTSTTAAGPVFTIDQNDTDMPLVDFQGNTGANTTASISTLTTSGATTHHIQCKVNNVKGWIAFSTNNPS